MLGPMKRQCRKLLSLLDYFIEHMFKPVLCRKKVALTDVVRRIDLDKSGFMLGFTPLEEDRDKCIFEVYDGGDDYRLFYRGKKLESIEKDKLYFPDLSHA